MPAILSRYNADAFTSSRFVLPALLLASSVFAYVGTPVSNSLLTSAIAWGAVCVYASLRLRRNGAGSAANGGKRLAWVAGGLLSLGAICERSVDGRGIWWAHGLLPATIYLFLHTFDFFQHDPDTPPASPDKSRMQGSTTSSSSKTSLTILTLAGVTASFAAAGSNATIALGLSYAIVTAFAFLLVERAHSEARNGRSSGGSVIYSANGLLSQPQANTGLGKEATTCVIRDVALASSIATGIAAISMESFRFGGIEYWPMAAKILGDEWILMNGSWRLIYGACLIPVHAIMEPVLLLMICQQSSLNTSFVSLAAAIISQLSVNFSFSGLWFAGVCAASTFIFFTDENEALSGAAMGGRRALRFNRILTLIAVISFGMLTVSWLREPYETYRSQKAGFDFGDQNGLETAPPLETLLPLKLTNTQVHPIAQLTQDAEAIWSKTLNSQSKSLEAAVSEYKRRYGVPPPPNFDKWYAFAKQRNVQLIDEYDNIYHSLLPFWGLSPRTIRERAQEAIGMSSNFMLGLLIRGGKVEFVEGGPQWLQEALIGMLGGVVEYLPDMDLSFNTHDEPRVVVPHEDLERLVQKAQDDDMPRAMKNAAPRNSFSAKPKDVSTGTRMYEAKRTRFNEYAHQPIWLPSRLSCPPDSAARALTEQPTDNLTAYATGDLGFVYNRTAFTDVCNNPSLSRTHGFFDRPNAFNIVHDLFPIFSQSKMSCFQDIIYPSPWYWAAKVDYESKRDMAWDKKINTMVWRGSTTGGFSRDGGWRRQHRQTIVAKLNALDKAKIMVDAKAGNEGPREWTTKSVPREDYAGTMDVHFSHIGQCDPNDCAAQKEFFGVSDGVDQQDHWKWRHLLDLDGNAFSGRFYAFLKSKSLVYKMAVFREWHEEWIKPWVHYVPLSLRGEEILETVRYFSSEQEGKAAAERLAEAGRGWAGKALRNEDFEVWFFRLLLEYGRLIDDDRDIIGYSGS